MMRAWIRSSAFFVVMAAMAAPASAQVFHSISFGFGVYTPRSFDSRVADDVLVADLTQPVIPVRILQ